jgi:hypothetical protein
MKSEGSLDMETTPDKYCLWETTPDYLPEALKELKVNGIEDVKIVPCKISVIDAVFNATEFTVTSYLIIYYNPPVNVVPGIGGDGDSATIQ